MSDPLSILMNAENPTGNHKKYVKKYKCPYCVERHERDKLYIHIQNKHEDMIPEGYTALRVAFNTINNKTEGHCIICQGVSDWNEDKGRYERLCNKKSCHDKYKKMVAERNKKKYGTDRLQTDPRFAEEVQKKALAGRKISGVYKFTDGGQLQYVGTYEKQLLEFMDLVMHCKSEDITGPGPAINYTLNGEKHLYLPDYYYIPYNLLIEIKDGGDNPNNHPHRIEEEKKNKAKEEAVRKLNKYNYVRVVNNDFSQLLTVMATLKYNMAENDDTPVIMTHESVLIESLDVPNQIDTIVFDFGGVLTQRNPNGEQDVDRWAKHHKLTKEDMDYLWDVWFNNKSGFKEHQSLKNAKKIFKENCDPKYHWLIDDWFTMIGGKIRIIATYAVSMLSNLKKKGYKLYFLSNMRQYIYESYQQVNFLDPILKYFIGGVFSFQTPYRKPDANIYKILIKKCKINPETSLFIDDKPDNVDAARSLGFTGIVFEAEPGATASSTLIVKDLMSMRSLNESSDNLEEIIVRNIQNGTPEFQYLKNTERHRIGISFPNNRLAPDLNSFREIISPIDDSEFNTVVVRWTDDSGNQIARVLVDRSYSPDGYIHFRDLSVTDENYYGRGLPEIIVNYIKKKFHAGATCEDKNSILWNDMYHRCGFIVDEDYDDEDINHLYYLPNKKGRVSENMAGAIGAALPPNNIPYYPNKNNYYVVQYPQNNVFAYGITKDPLQNTIYGVEQIDDDKYKAYKTNKKEIGRKYLTYKIKDEDLAKEVYNELENRIKYSQAVFYDTCERPQEYIYRRLSENCDDVNNILFNEDFELTQNPNQQIKTLCDNIYKHLKGANNLDILEKQINDLVDDYKEKYLPEAEMDDTSSSVIPVEFYNDWELKMRKVNDAELSGMVILVPNGMGNKYVTKHDIDELEKKHEKLQSITSHKRVLSNQTASSIFGYNNDNLYSMIKQAFSSNIQKEIREYYIDSWKHDVEDKYNALSILKETDISSYGYTVNDKLVPCFVILFAGEHKYNQLISKVSGSKFSHAELSLDSTMTKMYSMGSRLNSFTISNMYNQFTYYGNIDIRVFAFFVTKEQHKLMEKRIETYAKHINRSKYNFDMLYSYLINRKVESGLWNHICSSFVYSILAMANIHLGAERNTITPGVLNADIDDSRYYLVYDGKIKDYSPKQVDRTCKKLIQKMYSELKNKGASEQAVMNKLSGLKPQSYTESVYDFANIILGNY